MSDIFCKDILNHSPVGYAYYSVLCGEDGLPYDYEFIDANPAFAKMIGMSSFEIVGKKAAEILPSMWGGKSELSLYCEEIAINGGGNMEFEHYYEPLSRWYKINVFSPAKNHFVTYLTDITYQMKILEEQNTLNTFFNDIVIELDENFRYINYNPNKKYDFQQRQKIIGKTIREVYGLGFALQLESQCKTALASGKMESFIHKSPLPGVDRWFRTNIIYRTDSFKQNKYIIVTRDITEKVEAEKAIYAEKERLRVTLQSIGDAVIATDKSGLVISLNPVAEQLTGWSEQEAKGKSAQEVFHIISEKTREVCEDPVQKVLSSGNIIGLANHTALISKDGTERPIADSAAPIKDEAGLIHGVVLVFRDVTGEKLRQEEIEYLSYHDSLTGLYNRRFFEEELKRLDVERNLPMTLIIGDVNGLKLINDAFGHLVGDRLLQKAAAAIKQACRVDDIIARWGGDEFVIILPKTNQKSAVELIQRIRNSCVEAEVEAIKLSISLGYETKENSDEYISDVLKSAERNMYKNKLHESQSMVGSAIKVIHSTLLEKNHREAEHSRRVAKISKNIAKAMGLPEAKINEMETIGLMHDIGKIAIAEAILEKTGELTEDEWTEINRHPEVGYRILSTSNDTVEIARYVLAHHEHFDGNGYPSGTKGEEIPLQARILAVADAFDALTSERVHRAAYSLPYAIKVLQNNAGKQFDPEVVKIFIEKVLAESAGKESE